MEKKVLIAGGTGFLGRSVSRALSGAGYRVVSCSRRSDAEIRCDLTREDPPDGVGSEIDAIVNLAGISRETDSQGFEGAHLEIPKRLIRFAKEHAIRRFIHISVVASRPDPNRPYHDTKWRSEELVRKSGLDFTILKPGVIYGPGDDMVTHLVKMIRFSCIFPVVGWGNSILMPVHRDDVADAVVATLRRDAAIGKTYELVGPDRMPLKKAVRRIADALSMPLLVMPTPIWFQRISVWLMNRSFQKPISSPAQLQMLIDGLPGDSVSARAALGFDPRPFTVEEIRKLTTAIPSLFGISLRPCGC